MLTVERDTEVLIDNKLRNLGWNPDPHSPNRNVFMQRVATEEQKRRLDGKRPDYTLYHTGSTEPLAIIEAKKPGQNIHDALRQGIGYAEKLGAPIVFATDGVFTKTVHTRFHKPLLLNGEELDELINETLALRFLQTNDIATLDKKVIRSRGELISIFDRVNDLLREEGLQQGLERFTEFANILFLKVISEIEDAKGRASKIDRAYRWEHFKDKRGIELLSYVSDTVLKWFSHEYQDDNIFQPLQITHPDNLAEIVHLLDGLQLTDVNADVTGDAFEYFIRSYSASNPSDLGEIFTPRHVVKTMVRLVRPRINETIYDPFCGTGGMLISSFKYLFDTMDRTPRNIDALKRRTVFGSELTKTASIAKMNMILAGDGHSNIKRQDSLANPIDDQYDIILTNMPFAQKTRYGDKYMIPSRNGDIICPQHCFRALKEGGRMALIVPEGFLTNTNSRSYINVREYLLRNAKLQSVVSLPRGTFEPYNRAKADILYFTDVKKDKTRGHYWYFDVRNDGYTLDKRRRKVEGDNDLELVLTESDLEGQAEQYLLKLGVSKVDLQAVESNDYILSAAPYRKSIYSGSSNFPTMTIGELFEPSDSERIGLRDETPVMSITMNDGLIDQSEKFKKRIASANIANYKAVHRNELVVGFPIDEGVLGFQTKYDLAAVSPAYNIWRLKDGQNVDIEFLELVLRSPVMREVYKSKMQGAVDRRRSVPKDVFLSIEVPMPSADVRKTVLRKKHARDKALADAKNLGVQMSLELDKLWDK